MSQEVDAFPIQERLRALQECKTQQFLTPWLPCAGLLDALPEKRRIEDGGYSSDEDKVTLISFFNQHLILKSTFKLFNMLLLEVDVVS